MASSQIEFWNVVRENDWVGLEKLLDQYPDWVDARITGSAWNPGHIYNPQSKSQVVPPDDFPFSNTALHVASVNGRPELVRVLIEHGADVNAIGFEENKGLTPAIVLAAWEGCLDTMRQLINGGADLNLAASAETALYTAAEHGDAEKVKLLVEHGARHDIFTAAIVGDRERVQKFLLASPVLREARSLKRGRTPAEEAEHHRQHEIVALF